MPTSIYIEPSYPSTFEAPGEERRARSRSPTRARRILLLVTQLELGGGQKAVLQLARGLVGRGHSVMVVAMYDKIGIRDHFERLYGVPIVDLEMRSKTNKGHLASTGALVRGVVRFLLLMHRHRPDILQTFLHYADILGPPLGTLMGVPLRLSSQRIRLVGFGRLVPLLDRVIANSFMTAKVIAVSEAVRRDCIGRGFRASKLVTIHNGIPGDTLDHFIAADRERQLRRELDLNPGDVVITMVARLHRQKGHHVLLEALEQLTSTDVSYKVLLVGDGELRHQIAEMIAARHLSDRVLVVGDRRDVLDILKISDIFVLPSFFEGMPNAILEAMAAGLPVIATCVDGTPEVVIHDETGLLVPPGDAGGLRSALSRLLGDPPLRHSMGAAGRRRIAEHFLVDNMIDRFEALYLDLSKT